MDMTLIPTGPNSYRVETPSPEIPETPMSRITFRPNKKVILAVVCIVSVLALYLSSGGKSPEELRMEAALARIEALKSDCKTITQRITACFTSDDKSNCSQMQDSYAWFTREYGESPDFACSTQPDPLAFGAPKM